MFLLHSSLKTSNIAFYACMFVVFFLVSNSSEGLDLEDIPSEQINKKKELNDKAFSPDGLSPKKQSGGHSFFAPTSQQASNSDLKRKITTAGGLSDTASFRLIADDSDVDLTKPGDSAPKETHDDDSLKTTKAAAKPKSLLKLDIEELGAITVKPASPLLNNVPSSELVSDNASGRNVSTTGELLENASSVNVRRTSALNLDALVRGYNTEQTVAVANGMNELKTRIDIDSLFSQIDPGIVKRITVIDGPYSSLYGPGFAFMVAELNQGERYANDFQGHVSSTITYGPNGNTFYTRENAAGGGKDYSVNFSYGLRKGNDYRTGGDAAKIPSSYSKQDLSLDFSRDISDESRIDFTFLRTEINNLLLPGIIYDINNSTNNQFNVKYVIQEDKDGPEQFVLQGWDQSTRYSGDSTRASKQASFYNFFITPISGNDFATNSFVSGRSDSLGARSLATFGEADQPQLKIGADFRRATTVYREIDVGSSGQLIESGNMYGIPLSSQNDSGLFTDVSATANEFTTVSLGARLDYVWNQLDTNDPVIVCDAMRGARTFLSGLDPRHS